MPNKEFLSQNMAALLVYGRPPLVFAGMICAIAVMLTHNPIIYTSGVICLVIAMSFDLVDGWFSARYRPHAKLTHLADRIMDKVMYSMIFPLVATGMMWRFHFYDADNRQALLHTVFVLILCVTVLIRDNFAHFMRNFALRKGHEEEIREIRLLRTMIASPVSAILYSYAFYIPEGPSSTIYNWLTWLGNDLPMRGLFFLEITFLIINFASMAGYCRKYGTYCLDELCLGDNVLRRRILSVFPNFLTVMNAIMGVLAIFFAYQGRIREAYMILLGGALFDKLDGALARKLGLTTPSPQQINKHKKKNVTLGSILDDISDGVSFCIAPGVIFYVIMSRLPYESIQNLPYAWIGLLYSLMGISRLIYFTIDPTPIPGFFKGLPTPAAALFITAPLIVLQQLSMDHAFWAEQFALACLVITGGTAILMNAYPVRYIHFGRLMSRRPGVSKFTVMLVLGFVFTPYFGHAAFFYLLLYVLSPLITWRVSPDVASQESRIKTTPSR
ncbi:MAG: CDP-alcohol phosphatidyltransferase family protein [SAR324 cluster bacterium]|nr:CDP-alcohol phosphatidyltransferase family protein [SAR324 cluster bacterium]